MLKKKCVSFSKSQIRTQFIVSDSGAWNIPQLKARDVIRIPNIFPAIGVVQRMGFSTLIFALNAYPVDSGSQINRYFEGE